MAAVTLFDAEKCCHLVSAHTVSAQHICCSIHQLPTGASVTVLDRIS